MSKMLVLDKINKPNDIKRINPADLHELSQEIRQLLINSVAQNGGHLSSNLGVVELTMALHLFLDLPKDKLLFDVGHQSYVHKILTGRKDFSDLRKEGGLAGFPKSSESPCDSFDTGHSSTALSIACGFVTARELRKSHEKIVAVVGDGALGGGMSFEALNNISKLKSNLIIVLNDNEMSIDRNVGGLANYLGKIRTGNAYTGFKYHLESALDKLPGGENLVKRMKHSKDSIKAFFVKGMFFEDLGITYIGPIDGHDVSQVLTALENASRVNKPVIIHACTQKGRGYKPAEINPGKFHGIGPFDVFSGKIKSNETGKSFTKSFSEKMLELGDNNDKIIGITAAMEFGTGLSDFGKRFPQRFFDVGIAEQHAVTFAASLSKEGFVPIVAIYSSFLQRSYDQILHDVCLTGRHVVFMIDRAGITGPDGETHQGIFDLSFLSHIPGLCVMAPASCNELQSMLEFAVRAKGPCAIRYPKGNESRGVASLHSSPVVYGKAECVATSVTGTKKAVIFACGTVLDTCLKAKALLEQDGFRVVLYNARFVNPIDSKTILSEAMDCDVFCTVEDNVKRGGFGEACASLLLENHINTAFFNFSLPDSFIPQGKRTELLIKYGISAENIYGTIRQYTC